eukprot:TRINITY_DN26177_c0_g1_i1.p1 TRINITY_DN26177_c0_g1~~TRINITY_DN26177_c0_g1_i1.p1  ORF type:complete len:529 (-),score=13.41 TRINITY_DN26177_c0_g1_i1:235-1734(-)
MVEGPGCTNNGVKARTHKGRQIIVAKGKVVASLPNACLRHWTLIDVFTLGKELWLLFRSPTSVDQQLALRLHFGMNGSMFINGGCPRNSSRDHSLSLLYDGGGKLDVYGATVSVERSVQGVISKYETGKNRDVCSANGVFSAEASCAALSAQADRLLADAVLDQAVLPGVGNIIKNEALHRARLLPTRVVSTLSQADVRRVIACLRDYSMAWLKGRRHPACKIYNRVQCGDCKGRVSMQKLGETGLPRVTFWCSACCSLSRQSHDSNPVHSFFSRIPAQSRPRVPEACDVDLSYKNRQIKRPAENMLDGVIYYGNGDLDFPYVRQSTSRSVEGPPTKRRRWKRNVLKPQLASAHCRRIPSSVDLGSHPMAPFASCYKAAPQSTPSLTSLEEGCQRHGRKSLCLKRCRKENGNVHRLFFSCRSAGCNFFKWADAAFPVCKCQPVRKSVLRISKKEGSAGKWFFCCQSGGPGKSAGGRCDYFAWASDYQLAPIISLLSPLT